MEMNNPNSTSPRYWGNLTYDLLVNIFSTFHVLELVWRFSRVCSSWELACADPSLWETLDLTVLGDYILIPPPNAWSDESANLLWNILTYTFNLSRGNIKKLIFHFNASIGDEHLQLAAENCLILDQLVLPPSRLITVGGIERALMVRGSSLKSMVVPFITHSSKVMLNLIGAYCHNLKELKFTCCLSMEMAKAIVTYLPSLKILSLRGAIMDRDSLEFLLENMVNLEVLNITHSLVIHNCSSCNDRLYLFPDLTKEILEKASRLLEFYNCDKLTCETCEQKYLNLSRAIGEINWDLYNEIGEEFWREDEIKSLAY